MFKYIFWKYRILEFAEYIKIIKVYTSSLGIFIIVGVSSNIHIQNKKTVLLINILQKFSNYIYFQ